MKKDDLKNKLQAIDIPKPSENKKAETLELVRAEFVRSKNNHKGFAESPRLKEKQPSFRRFIMQKPYIISGAVACSVLFLALASGTLLQKPAWQGEEALKHPAKHLTEPSLPVATNGIVSDQRDKAAIQATAPMEAELDQSDAMPASPPAQLHRQEAKKTEGLSAQSSQRSPSLAKEKADTTVGAAYGGAPAMETNVASSIAPMPAYDMVAPQKQYVGKDKFEDKKENAIKVVKEEPVSTFSIDVDTSSYSFIRRMLNEGALPQKDAVRVEEMVNYFDYDYALPDSKDQPFKPTIAVYPTPWNKDTKLVHIGIKAHDIIPADKPKANLVFLIDTSGSMEEPTKLPLLRNAFRLMVENLSEEDTVSIVTYAGSAGTALEPTKVKDRQKILAALDNLYAGGSTAGAEGIRQAYALAEQNFDKKGVNRVILATDGDFNVGITNQEELQDFIERKRDTGISLSVLGFGQGNYNDAMMQTLAQNGNGNAAYIDNLNEARKVLVQEASSTLFTVAKDVKIQMEFNPSAVSEYRLIGYETRMLNREDFNNDKVDAGEVGSGHAVTAIYEITPTNSKGKLVDDSRYAPKAKEANGKMDGKDNSEYGFLKIRYKLPDGTESKLITSPITTEKEYKTVDDAPESSRFATSVAAFGQLLEGSNYTKNYNYDDVVKLAESAKGKDQFGYRAEFINLVRLAKSGSALQRQ